MLSQERIRLMVRLEKNNSRENRKNRKISRFFRSDYVALALIRRFFSVTIAYILLLALVALGYVDYISENITKFDFKALGVIAGVGYIIILAAYMILTVIINNVKYRRAKKKQREYERDLKRLEKLYAYEEQLHG